LNNSNKPIDTAPEGAPSEYCEAPDAIDRCEQVSQCAGCVDRATVESLIECLGDTDPMVRWEASLALADSAHNLLRPQDLSQVLAMGSSVAISANDLLSILEQKLETAAPAERAAVAETLGRLPHQRAVLLLERALSDETAMVRATAARGLGQLGALESSSHLVDALVDPSLWVRRAAADALGAIGDQKAVEPLIALAQQGPVLTRTSALAALGHLPGKPSRETLIACLDDEEGEVRWQAARSLEAVGTSAALPALERLLGDGFVLFDEPVRAVALSAMRAIGQREQGAWHALRLAIIKMVGRFRRRH